MNIIFARFYSISFAIIFILGATTAKAQNWSPSGSLGLACMPAFKLDIATGAVLDGIRIMHNDQKMVKIHSGSLHALAFNPITQEGDAGIVYGSTAGPLNFGFLLAPLAGAESGLRMDQDGNVGIGCHDTKGYKLAVAGTAIFTKVVVKSLPWSDYVFNTTYRLRPLSEVEQFIKTYHHLPEVLPAEEVEKNGIDVGDNQATLLKKIEELTLYAIEQEKQIRQLREENRDLQLLKKEVEEMKTILKEIKK
ncbi:MULTISPECIES: hypothetical protein [Niastella]|uniref:Uncharacterized protein n=1 Tax=Niastella soli TaxID=2821487 RepID=A0ABS3Z0Z9_9BACT|nr:hypothetical protein [Niastella soli]MBO9203828.1 hypothetical protein [Niastella soli]